MSTSKTPSTRMDLEHIEDALIDSILNSSGEELRDEIAATGLDPDSIIQDVEASICAAKSEIQKKRLQTARLEYEKWAKRDVNSNIASIDTARQKLNKIRSGDSKLDEKMTLAARKGEGLSDSDLEGLLEDLAALNELDNGEDNQ